MCVSVSDQSRLDHAYFVTNFSSLDVLVLGNISNFSKSFLMYVYMYIYICIYVYMYICIYVCMYVCMHACMHACMYISI